MAKFTLKTLFPLGFSFTEKRGANGKKITVLVLWGKYQGKWTWKSGSPNIHRDLLPPMPPCRLHTKMPLGRPKYKKYNGYVLPRHIEEATIALTQVYRRNKTTDPETMALATLVRDYNKAFEQIPQWALEDAEYIMLKKQLRTSEKDGAFGDILGLLNWLGPNSRDYILSDYPALVHILRLTNDYRWGKRMHMMKHLMLQKRRVSALRKIFYQLKPEAINQLNKSLVSDLAKSNFLSWYGHNNYRNDLYELCHKTNKLKKDFHDIREQGPDWKEYGMFDMTYIWTTDAELLWLDSLLNLQNPAAQQRNNQILMFIEAIADMLHYYWRRNMILRHQQDGPQPRLNQAMVIAYKDELLSCKGSQSLRELHDTLMHPYRRDIAAMEEWNKQEAAKHKPQREYNSYKFDLEYQRKNWIRQELQDVCDGKFPSPIMDPSEEIKYISTREELIARGQDQSHCVGDYAGLCETGDYYCYTVDYQDQTATLMLNEKGTIVQLYGPKNSLVSQEMLDMVNLWQQMNEGMLRENQMTHYKKLFKEQAKKRFPILEKEEWEVQEAERKKLEEAEALKNPEPEPYSPSFGPPDEMLLDPIFDYIQ